MLRRRRPPPHAAAGPIAERRDRRERYRTTYCDAPQRLVEVPLLDNASSQLNKYPPVEKQTGGHFSGPNQVSD
jgi:hypothetical protein